MSKKSKGQKGIGDKNRHNITISEETKARGEELAVEYKRSFSNLLEVLIDAEYARRQQAKEKEVAA